MKKVTLFIDTSSNQVVEITLSIENSKDSIKKELDKKRAQVVLPLIDQLLKKHNLSPLDLTEIMVNTGPGSFTGLRVGVSIANTLGASLNIPINGLPIGQIVEPQYS